MVLEGDVLVATKDIDEQFLVAEKGESMKWTKDWPKEKDVLYFYRGSGGESDPRTIRMVIVPSHLEDRCFTMRLSPTKLSSFTWVAGTRYAHAMHGEFSSTPIPMPEEP